MKPQIFIKKMAYFGLITRQEYEVLAVMLGTEEEPGKQVVDAVDYFILKIKHNEKYDYYDRLRLFFWENDELQVLYAKWSTLSMHSPLCA